MPLILIIDDEESLRYTFRQFLTDEGYEVAVAANLEEAIDHIKKQHIDMIFADILLGTQSGLDILGVVRERHLTCPVVIITGAPDLNTAAKAVRLGAFDYLSKPVLGSVLLRLADRGIKHKKIVDEKEYFRIHLQAIFRSVKDGIIAVDHDLKIIAMNDANKKFCGCTDNMIGKPLTDAYLYCHGRCLAAIQQAIETKKPAEFQRVECLRDNLPSRIVTLTASPLSDDGGSYLGAVLVKRDETQLAELEQRLDEQTSDHGIVGGSPEIRETLSMIDSLANVETTVLILGESGTGKELAAKAIHSKGPRKSGPYVKVNCAALPDDLLASELFGHIKGSFTGAMADRIGRFQQAAGGTIFLDEIGDISTKMQLSLLRVLQEREFERVGESLPRSADVRIIAATNRNLRKKMEAGEFREDLFYRLNVIPLHMPALRDRKTDIPLLVRHFIHDFSQKYNKRITNVSDDVMRVLIEYPWPGNVRELRHAIEHAFVVARNSTITIDDLPAEMHSFAAAEAQNINSSDSVVDAPSLRRALTQCAGNKAKAARLVGISRRTIYRKLKEFGIDSSSD
jgi:PAS domain S-box-containing protein